MNEHPPETPEGLPQQGGSTAHADIDPTYAQKALEQVKTALQGNGVQEEEITLKSFDGEILEVLAATTLLLKTNISERKETGKVTGMTVVDGPPAMREAIEKEQYKITHSQDVIKRIKETILERPDKGFGLENELIKLPFLHKNFAFYEECQGCRAQGQIKCQRCHGDGYEECPRCHSVGMEPCTQCSGNGQVPGPNGQQQTCPRCHGEREISCSLCQQKKRIQCSVCKTKGAVTCKHCNGHAWHSNISAVEIDAIANFDYAKENLPEKIHKLIARLGPKLPQHVQIMAIEQDKEPEQDQIVLPYKVGIPHGDIVFDVQGEEVPGFVFGTKCKLRDTPYFVEHIIAPGIESLRTAAQGKGDVKGHIKKAVQYKTLKHAIMAAVKFKKQKAFKAVLKGTPVGLAPQTAQQLVEFADQAIKNLTRQSSMMGMGVGGVAALVIGAAYFFSPLRAILQTQLNIPYAGDALALILACAVGYFIADFWIKGARRKVIQSIL